MFAGDVAALFAAVSLSYAVRIYLNNDWYVSFNLLSQKFTPWLLLVIVPHLFTLYLLGQYNLNRLISRVRSSIFIILSVLLAGLIIGSIFFFLPGYIFGRQVLLIHLLFSSVFLVGWRIIFHEVVAGRERAKRMAVIGDYDIVSRYVREILEIAGESVVLSAVCLTENKNIKKMDAVIYPKISALLASDDFDILVYDRSNYFYRYGKRIEACRHQ